MIKESEQQSIPPEGTRENEREEIIRNELKAIFSCKGNVNNDPIYTFYKAIDDNIDNIITDASERKSNISKIIEFSHTLYFILSNFNFVNEGFVNDHSARYGTLTNGVLFHSTKKGGQSAKLVKAYSIQDLAAMPIDKYNSVANQVKSQFEDEDATMTWYFWPGCEMKIPKKARLMLSTDVQGFRFIVTKKGKQSFYGSDQISMQEEPYQLAFSYVEESEFYNIEKAVKEIDNEISNGNFEKAIDMVKSQKKYATGFYSINKSSPKYTNGNSIEIPENKKPYSEVDWALLNGEDFDYLFLIPYLPVRFDVRTVGKIFSKHDLNGKASSEVDELIATSLT